MNLKKAKPICMHFTLEAMALIEKEMLRLGVSKTAVIEMAVRKAYGEGEPIERKDSDKTPA